MIIINCLMGHAFWVSLQAKHERHQIMRTTLTIDDDVLAAVRARAQYENRAIGDVLSELARSALRAAPSPAMRNGLPILQRANAAQPVTLEAVTALREDGQ
jgi:uncharacterized membrane protein